MGYTEPVLPAREDALGVTARLQEGAFCQEEEANYMELSARNQLPGTVKEIHLGGVMAEVTVELAGGQTVVSAITRSSAERLNLQVGDAVTVIIKSTEVILGK
jgi:molybdopterin-binding protein